MDEVPIVGRREESIFKEVLAHYDAPAYVRRARAVQDAFEDLLDRCRRQREEWLPLVRIRLGVLRALAGEWERLGLWLADDEQVRMLQTMHAELDPRLRLPVEPTSSARTLLRALRELGESIERFNRRWQAFLEQVDLSWVNQLRDGYNRYYLLEKECAVRSSRVAHQGFRKLAPLTMADLQALLPPLPVPQLRPG
jgi:hypothetical protein